MIEYSGKQVTIMACSDCNANCAHCYISYKGNLTGNELLNICNAFKDKYKIIINGTEVLLHDDYFDALAISNQNRVLTNGIIIKQKPDILKKINKSGISRIAMSYHFESDVSDVSKRIVEDNIKLIQQAGMDVELMCTITTANYDKLDIIFSKALELGANTIRLFNCINTGRCLSNHNSMILRQEEIDCFFEQLREGRLRYSKDTLKIKRNGTFGRDRNNNHCHFKCNAGVDEVVITPSGDVYPCIFMTKPGYEIGKYIDGKIMLFELFENDGSECIVHEVFNNNNEEAFVKKLTREKK